MPELPEVETVRRSLLPHLVGQRIVNVHVRQPKLRWPVSTEALKSGVENRRILDIRRRAKYLLLDVEDNVVVAIHLGMSGRLSLVQKDRTFAKHDHVIFHLDNQMQLRFHDPRRFGSIDSFFRQQEVVHPRLAHLGLEPLDPHAFGEDALYTQTRGKKKPIKNFLMDATELVGVGNIYACEALYAAQIHPNTVSGRLSRARCGRLAEAVVSTLSQAIEQGGTTLRDFADGEGNSGYFAVRLQVYGRTGRACGVCQGLIRRVVHAGRSTFYCPKCQH